MAMVLMLTEMEFKIYRVKPGVGVDVNGDGIADYRTGARVQPGPGMAMGRGGYGYGGYRY